MFGEEDLYRALIAQLASVTGAPDKAPSYFARLASFDGQAALPALHKALADDEAFKSKDARLVLRILESAGNWGGGR